MNPKATRATTFFLAAVLTLLWLAPRHGAAQVASDAETPGDQMLAAYFRAETAALADQCLKDIRTLDDWESRREEYRRQLQEMLGLSPLPERTPLQPEVTGTIAHESFIVERLHFQASPGLYVTANLYRPKEIDGPLPAILYLSGHYKEVQNGVSMGNKTGYQHHGAWFARNGYVCLVLDTLQLGEIEGLHHGTHLMGMWWWNSRGYTPAGVEAWLGIRALDYLEGRPDVDPQRIGLTGRSGGGSYSWTVAALDDRVKVVAPVAGITDLQNYVVDGAIEGHCDCMFFVNTYRWDYPLAAALVAPRPLLIANTDKDRIFPLDGVVRLHEKVRRIYALHEGATNRLGLLITDGPHKDSQDLQLPVFRWFNRHLKGADPVIEMAAPKFFKPADLKVFDILPADQVNTTLHETFVVNANQRPEQPVDPGGAGHLGTPLDRLRTKVFAGWPKKPCPLETRQVFSAEQGGLLLEGWDFNSHPELRLRLYMLRRTDINTQPERLVLAALDDAGWVRWVDAMRPHFGPQLARETLLADAHKSGTGTVQDWGRELDDGKTALAFIAPRGIGLSAWTGTEKQQAHIRRRFMLLGQTLDGMRVWDIRRALEAASEVVRPTKTVELRGDGTMGVNCVYASLFEPAVNRLALRNLPGSHMEGPDYLNVLQVWDIPQALSAASTRCEVRVQPPLN